MATRLEKMQTTRENYVKKVAEMDKKIEEEVVRVAENKEKETKKLIEAQKAYEALYGKLEDDAWGDDDKLENPDDSNKDEDEFEFSDEPSTPEPEYPTKKVKTKNGDIITVRLIDGKWTR